MATGELAVARDAEGYLVSPEEWSEAVADLLARGEGIALTAGHWEVIHFMREFYAEHQVAADARYVLKFLASRHPESARARLYALFPYGYVQQACKIAGMRKPRAWSTG